LKVIVVVYKIEQSAAVIQSSKQLVEVEIKEDLILPLEAQLIVQVLTQQRDLLNVGQ
jgi:hypothetical protein